VKREVTTDGGDSASRTAKYRFLLIQPFKLPEKSRFAVAASSGPKERQLVTYSHLANLLDDIDWDIHPGPPASHGDWPVENREEFALAAAARLPIVREACASGRYNAVVLLGGGEPGFDAAREIGKRHGVAVTANAWSQMHVACMLGNKFSVIDIAESHSMYYYSLIVAHGLAHRCASIRSIDYPFARPGHEDAPSLIGERRLLERGETSPGLERAVVQAIAAIEEDGAEVITLGCAATFWLRPHLETRLHEIGWDVPVLDGYSCSIAHAKLLVDLRQTVSGVTFPPDHPTRLRPRKPF
jgi:Asp/Glu/hydantoin racemase